MIDQEGGFLMQQNNSTHISALQVRTRHSIPRISDEPVANWTEKPMHSGGGSLMKNIAVSAALVLCAVTLRTGALPQLSDAADLVLTAASDNSLLDEQLGKLSFVSTLFPEAVLVFGAAGETEMLMPVNASYVVHTWSETEPYMSWYTNDAQVISACAGEVIGIYHGNGDEHLVQVMGDHGIACLYGNLSQVDVEVGDAVAPGTILGQIIPGEECVFELRKDGRSIDPYAYFLQ